MLDDNKTQKKYYGKYRGTVTDNNDEEGLGRIRAKVQLVLEDKEIGWAMPCVPYAGDNVGMFFVPPEKSNVWIEFEGGDIQKPIFSGCFWGKNQVPNQNINPNIKIIKTEHATFSIDDRSDNKKIEIKTDKEQKITIVPDYIELFHDDCSVKVTSDSVFINGQNLQIKK
jgi:uncharacterized protein involved in type VI secretion and phage assembly